MFRLIGKLVPSKQGFNIEYPASFLLFVTKPESECCELPIKTPEEVEEEKPNGC